MEKLERSLSEAFVTDAKRKAEDEMKKRAIVSARSYDEFRHLVAAAQQRPIDPGDINRKHEVSHNRAVGSAALRIPGTLGFDLGLDSGVQGSGVSGPAMDASGNALPALCTTSSTSILPRSPGEFDRAWRRLPKDDASRARYLSGLGPDRLRVIFAPDIDGDVVGTLLRVLATHCVHLTVADGMPESAVGPAGAAAMALALSTSAGFSLAVDLLGKEDLGHVKTLVHAAQAAGAEEIAQKLRKAYGL